LKKNNKNLKLKTSDELLHHSSNEFKWRESYYFNWVDLVNKISGFSTIGILPNQKKREFVFVLFLKESNEIYYKEPVLSNYEADINTMLQDKRLLYELLETLKNWRIKYQSRKLIFEIEFKTRFPNYNFAEDSSASWHHHFEASGEINGRISFKDGNNIKIHGYGQRDKSWGYRDWHQFDKWYAGHFQFKDWSCAFRKDYIGKNVDLSGYTSNKNENIPLSEVEINTVNSKDQFKSPLKSSYKILNINRELYLIESNRIKRESFIRFARDFLGGYTELFEQMVIIKNLNTGEIGSGMMEHLRTYKF
jgi:hypothetical protein